jgi:peptidoglycan/LPS O-acetylase OafA/YrhL
MEGSAVSAEALPGRPNAEAPATRGGSRLPSLTGLRFVAALTVFGFHVHVQGLFADARAARVVSAMFGQGATGVGFFFLLSGFVLTWSARPGVTARTIWRRRAAKIVPNHVVTWLIALVGLLYAGSHSVSFGSAAANLVLVQAWIPIHDVFFGVNTPAWSLSCEAAFYAAFPLLLRGVGRVREQRLWPLACLLVGSILLVPALALPLHGEVGYWLVYVFPATRALEFVLGMVLARIVRTGRWIGLGLWPATALFLVGYVASGYLPGGFAYVAGTVIPLALLIPAAAVADVTGRPSPWRNRTCVWLGEISFALYLLHQIVIRYLDKALGAKSWATLPAVAFAVAMLLVALVGAWLLYRIVERPMMRLLQSPRPRGITRTRP